MWFSWSFLSSFVFFHCYDNWISVLWLTLYVCHSIILFASLLMDVFIKIRGKKDCKLIKPLLSLQSLTGAKKKIFYPKIKHKTRNYYKMFCFRSQKVLSCKVSTNKRIFNTHFHFITFHLTTHSCISGYYTKTLPLICVSLKGRIFIFQK